MHTGIWSEIPQWTAFSEFNSVVLMLKLINDGTSNPYKNNNHELIAPTFPGTLKYFHKYITKREKQIKF